MFFKKPKQVDFADVVFRLVNAPDPYKAIQLSVKDIPLDHWQALELLFWNTLKVWAQESQTFSQPKFLDQLQGLNLKRQFATDVRDDFLLAFKDTTTDRFTTELCDLHLQLMTLVHPTSFLIAKAANQALTITNFGEISRGDKLVDRAGYRSLLKTCHAFWLLFPLTRSYRTLWPKGLLPQ